MRTNITSVCVMMLLIASSVVLAQDTTEKQESNEASTTIKIRVAYVFVDDQEVALKFYTEVLGFVKKDDILLGEFRWLTVVSQDNPDGAELLLEPNQHPAAKTFQEAIFKQGMPATTLFVEDIQKTYEKLQKLGVKFTMQPTEMGTTIAAIFDDTCGNLIMIAQE